MANIGYLQLVRHCNQHCRFCSNPESGRTLTLAEAKAQVDDLVGRGYFGVVLSGGEPTLSDEVIPVARYAEGRGLHVRIITNGSRVAERRYAAELVAAGIRHFHVSVHSSRAETQDFLSGTPGSHARIMRALDVLGSLAVTVDINTVINHYNADHLDEMALSLLERFPFVHHYVWNNLDPSMGRAETQRDTAPHLWEFELALHRAMTGLQRRRTSFRVERVPLCYMTEFAHCSTETRKIVKGEERTVHFLDSKGLVRQTSFVHHKASVCSMCSLDSICAGLFERGSWYDERELYPVFVAKEPIVERILAGDSAL
jgi:MoaA/NifB/PqqE/SkfB family radical SAM enzyme